MKDKPLLKVAFISIISAIVVVVILRFLGQENPAVIGGGVAGGIAGAVSTGLFKKKRD